MPNSPQAPGGCRIFLAEKGIEIERVMVDLRRNEQLTDPYLAANPRGTVPALELDDGEVICEIGRDLPLFRGGAAGARAVRHDRARYRARSRSWTRRIESDGYAAAVYAFRNVHPAFQDRAAPGKWPAMPQIPELGARGLIMWGAFIDLARRAAGGSRLDRDRCLQLRRHHRAGDDRLRPGRQIPGTR